MGGFIRVVVVAIVTALVAIIAIIVRPFGITLGVPGGPPKNCEDPRSTSGDPPPTPGCGPNPWQCVTTSVTVNAANGALAEYPECEGGPHTLVRAQSGFIGLDTAANAELRFSPSSASYVTIQVVHFSAPGRVEAFRGASLADMKLMAATPGVLQQLQLNGSGIDRIVVTPASPAVRTLVIGWCH
jgi:hypothetical protein